jgi:hypothetical protein
VPQIVVAVALVWLVVSIVLVFTVPVARVLFQSISLIVASVLVTPTCILFYRRIQTIIHNGRDSPSVMMARQVRATVVAPQLQYTSNHVLKSLDHATFGLYQCLHVQCRHRKPVAWQ